MRRRTGRGTLATKRHRGHFGQLSGPEAPELASYCTQWSEDEYRGTHGIEKPLARLAGFPSLNGSVRNGESR